MTHLDSPLFVSALFLLWPAVHFKFLWNFIGSCECYKFVGLSETWTKVNESTLHHATHNVSWSNSLWHHTVTAFLTLLWNQQFLCVSIEEFPALTELYLLYVAACPLVGVNYCWKNNRERASSCHGASRNFTLLIIVLSIDNGPISTYLSSVSLARQGDCYNVFADWPLTCLSVPLVFMVGLGFRGPTWAGTGVLCRVCCRKKDDRVTGRWMDGATGKKKKKDCVKKTPLVVKLEWTQS